LSPWTNNPYGNEWIDYSKKYVRVGVQANGLHKVSFATLSASLGTGITPAQIQLWHRGKEVAIISADNAWVVFYGEKNDGASDGLMFRPGPEARLNPYVSFFSEEGSYFFTTSASPLRAVTTNGDPSGTSLTAEPFHVGKILKKYDTYQNNASQGGQTRENLVGGIPQQQFAYTTFGEGSTLNTSYYTRANAWVGPTVYGSGAGKSPTFLDNTIDLPQWKRESGNPKLEILVNGLNTGYHDVEVFVSPSVGGLQDASKRVASMPFYSFGGEKRVADLLLNTNISEDGTAQIRVSSKSVGNSQDWFGLSYFTVTYPKAANMSGATNATFEFPSTPNSESLVSITAAVSGSQIYDLSNPEIPVLISNASYDSQTSTISFLRSRVGNRSMQILVVAPSVDATALTTINSVNFDPYYAKTNAAPKTATGAINPAAYEYLILTNDDSPSDPARRLKAGAKAYAENYRSLPEGGNYRTLVMDMRTIYDQFNYGEPSAMAIRRFVDYMIQDGKNENDNLLLIGYSVMLPVRIIKEMPGEVPTFGDPGSDILLVTGLKNSPSEDVPAMPVGRINSFTLAQLSDYLTKVKYYENETNTVENLDWRKKVLHIVGAKYAFELNQFKNIFSSISSHIDITKREIITPLISNDEWATSNSVDAPTKTAPISGPVNNGVGMISYYGHGNQTQTIYDLGNVSGGAFTNNNKFSFVYFNGCGVGNVFTSRAGHALSTNWLITPQKGAIAIFGNSYKSYVTPTQVYIDRLYTQIFEKPDYGNGARKTVGKILQDVASLTIDGSIGSRIMATTDEISNIHQTNLYGDPALKVLIITPRSALPVTLISFNASIVNESQVQLNWRTTWEKNNSHFVIERSYNGKNFEEIGYLEGKGTVDSESKYSFVDSNPHPGVNYYRLGQVDLSNSSSNQQKTYSNIVTATVPGSEAVLIYPNPTADDVSIQINVPVALKEWVLWNVNGERLKTGSSKQISLRSLSSGKYIIEIISENGDSFKRSILRK
jgi:hypothetical protein